MMGDTIGVESVGGKGSTFWLTVRLPRRPAPSTARQVNLAGLGRLRVLGVDDNATNRALLADQVSSWGMHVDCVASAYRALESLRLAHSDRRPYDVAILDHQMPDMDGIMLTRPGPRRRGQRRVDVVANGLEALEALARIAYDCVFLDCQMPEMDGFEATKMIRRREARTGSHVPIVAMTANAMDLRTTLEKWIQPAPES